MTEGKLSTNTDKLLGEDLISMLSLKVKKNGRVDTSWGDKTPMGIGATVRRVVNESAPELLQENERLRAQLAELREAMSAMRNTLVIADAECQAIQDSQGWEEPGCEWFGFRVHAIQDHAKAGIASYRAALARTEGGE